MKKALAAMKADPAHTANMGDQIFTDVWAGRRMKLYTVLVPPIKDKRDLFTRFKRLLERPFKKAYYKKKEKRK
jgi:predicted HAD superfamily phosphohydrolase YqeG